MGSNQFCLKWNNHNANMTSVFEELLSSEAFVDVTLVCECQMLKAHKLVLSACSPFFQSLFLANPCKHPIIILKDVKYAELKTIVNFMYRGEVNVSNEQLSTLFKTAEALKVKGLTTENAEEKTAIDHDMAQLTASSAQVISVGRSSLSERSLPETHTHRKRKARTSFHINNTNFMDSEDHRQAKVKVSTSLDCVQDLRKDKTKSIPVTPLEVASSNEFHIQALVHSSIVPNMSVQTQSLAALNAQVSSTSFHSVASLSAEEPEFVEATTFSEETSNAEDADIGEKTQVFAESQPGKHHVPPSSPHLVTSNSDSFGDDSHPSQNSLPDTCRATVVSAEPSSSCLNSQDTGQNIKTKGKELFEDSPLLSTPDSPYCKPEGGSSTLSSERITPSLAAAHNSGSSSISQEDIENSSPQNTPHENTSPQQNEGDSSRHSTTSSNSFVRPLCPYCRRIFYSPGNLKRHVEIHFLNRKNYICHICHKRFSWKNTLNSHLRRDHHLQV